MFGRENKKKELIKNLNATYEKIQREHQISPGDFPEIKRMQVGRCGTFFFSETILEAVDGFFKHPTVCIEICSPLFRWNYKYRNTSFPNQMTYDIVI